MNKTWLRTVVMLAVALATVSGSLVVRVTQADAAEASVPSYCQGLPEHALRSGFVPSACVK